MEVEALTSPSGVDKLAKGEKLNNFVRYLKFLDDKTRPFAYVGCWWNVGCRWNIGICRGCNNSCYVHLNYGLTDCYGTKLLNCTMEWHKEAIELFFLGQLNGNLKRKRRDLHFGWREKEKNSPFWICSWSSNEMIIEILWWHWEI